MRIHKFTSTDAFVAIDLDGAEAASGPVRWARKVLQGGAKDLARSQTYTYAVLGMQRSGGSAGISADGPDRGAAIEAFVTEAAPLVADGTYLPDPAKGVGLADLAPLHDTDPRDTARFGAVADRCEALSAAVTADAAATLDGRTVAIEGFADTGPALAAAVIERGARITAIATADGTVTRTDGFSGDDLRDAWAEHGAGLVTHLGDVAPSDAVFDHGAAVVFAGSKMGVIDHGVAARLSDAAAVVACGRLPLTARALAVLRHADVAVPADFVALAGSTLALWGDEHRDEAEILAGVREDVGDLCARHAESADGLFLGACHDAEAFLGTWQPTLPFGRPLAP